MTLSIAHLAHDTFSSFLAPLLPLLIDKLGLSLSMSAFLDIIRRIPALFNPFFGLMAEKTGIKYFVILTPAVTAISMGLVGLANSTVMLLLLLFVAGVSAALFHIPSPVMVKDVSGNRVGTGMSFFMVGGELARTLGPLLVISAVSWWSLEEIYRLIPLGLLASFVLFLKLRNYTGQQRITKPKEQGDTRKLLRLHSSFFIFLAGFILFRPRQKRPDPVSSGLPDWTGSVSLVRWNFTVRFTVLRCGWNVLCREYFRSHWPAQDVDYLEYRHRYYDGAIRLDQQPDPVGRTGVVSFCFRSGSDGCDPGYRFEHADLYEQHVYVY